MYENTLAGLVSLAVALGALAPVACTRADSAASGEAALEDSASNRGIVNQVSFRSLVSQAGQHLLVVTEAPGDIRGRLFRMEWVGGGDSGESGAPAADASWRQVGSPIAVIVGRSGVGPKQEGDGRSPQGVFALGPVFGYAQELPTSPVFGGPPVSSDPALSFGPGLPGGLALPYQPMAPGSVCVDDVGSAYYNRILDADTLSRAKDWISAEAMRRDLAHGDDLYRWGVVVRHNEAAAQDAGSCIFLHVWRASDSPTEGCTAMAEDDLLAVLGWLRAGSRRGLGIDPGTEREPEAEGEPGPILVQGTRAYLEGLSGEGVIPYRIPRTP